MAFHSEVDLPRKYKVKTILSWLVSVIAMACLNAGLGWWSEESLDFLGNVIRCSLPWIAIASICFFVKLVRTKKWK